MSKSVGMLVAALAGSLVAPAQQAPAHKELTARELFYTAAAPAAAAKPAATTPEAKPPARAARPVTQAAAPKVDTPRAERKAVAHSTPPPAAPAAAASPDGTPIVTAAVRRTAPAPASGQPLGLRYVITRMVDGNMVEVPADSTFHAGDRIRITVVANSPGYLYIITQGSSGTWKPIFPSADVEDGNNRVEPFRDYVLPPKSRMVFDSQAGVEKLFVVLSREPENDLEQMIYSLRSPGKATPAAEPEAPKETPKLLVAANISNDMVGHMRNVYARDLVIEKVDAETPGGNRRENAVYVVNPTGSADSRVVADIALAHQ